MSKERVKKHRDALKEKGYKQINVMISEEAHEKIKVAQIRMNKNFSEVINILLLKERFLTKKDTLYYFKLKKMEKGVTSNENKKKRDK